MAVSRAAAVTMVVVMSCLATRGAYGHGEPGTESCAKVLQQAEAYLSGEATGTPDNVEAMYARGVELECFGADVAAAYDMASETLQKMGAFERADVWMGKRLEGEPLEKKINTLASAALFSLEYAVHTIQDSKAGSRSHVVGAVRAAMHAEKHLKRVIAMAPIVVEPVVIGLAKALEIQHRDDEAADVMLKGRKSLTQDKHTPSAKFEERLLRMCLHGGKYEAAVAAARRAIAAGQKADPPRDWFAKLDAYRTLARALTHQVQQQLALAVPAVGGIASKYREELVDVYRQAHAVLMGATPEDQGTDEWYNHMHQNRLGNAWAGHLVSSTAATLFPPAIDRDRPQKDASWFAATPSCAALARTLPPLGSPGPLVVLPASTDAKQFFASAAGPNLPALVRRGLPDVVEWPAVQKWSRAGFSAGGVYADLRVNVSMLAYHEDYAGWHFIVAVRQSRCAAGVCARANVCVRRICVCVCGGVGSRGYSLLSTPSTPSIC